VDKLGSVVIPYLHDRKCAAAQQLGGILGSRRRSPREILTTHSRHRPLHSMDGSGSRRQPI